MSIAVKTQMTKKLPDFLTQEPADIYHSRTGDYLSSHRLGDFRKCPELFHRKQLGLIKDTDSKAYLLGRAAHTLILEGRDAFDAEFVVGGPVNPKTGKPYGTATKAYGEWAASQTRDVLTVANAQFVERLATAVSNHEVASEFLSGGVAETVCRSEYHGLPCQIRPDYFRMDRGIIDLKTCDDLTWFEADARRYGYAHQMAFYRAVLFCASGIWASVHIVAVEKSEPFRVGVWRIQEDALDAAKKENEAAIDYLKACMRNDVWPTGYETVRLLETA